MDSTPIKLLPTWRNGRRGRDYIAKRLDRFFIDEKLMVSKLRYRTWECNENILDHMLVILHMEKVKNQVQYPFKFNSDLLKDELFGDLVREVWNAQQDSTRVRAQSRLVGKLCRLKSRVKKCIAIKKKREQ